MNIFHIQSIKNFEEELLYSSNIKRITDMFKDKSIKDFKKSFCNCTNLIKKLEEIHFDLDKMWKRKTNNVFKEFYNEVDRKKL